MGEEEGVGLAAALGVFVLRLGGDQRQVALCGRPMRQIGVAHQPLRHALGVDLRQAGQGTGHQQFGDADAKGPGEQLEADHQALSIQLRP